MAFKFYELPAEFAAIDHAIEEASGELTEEIMERLERAETTLERKAEAIAILIREADAEADAMQGEIDRLRRRRETAVNRAKSLKGYLYDTMNRLGRERIEAGTFKVRVQRNSIPTITCQIDPIDLPIELVRTQIEFNTPEAHQWLKRGMSLPPGVVVTWGSHLRIS